MEKGTKKSVRHWLITELGHNGTENIHLHGIIYTDNPELIEKHWRYGFIWRGKREFKNGTFIYKNYVSEQTINYIIKYATKVNFKHKYYKPAILCSKGIGKNYINSAQAKDKNDFYITRKGNKIALPIYYRNAQYSEQEREKLWLKKLDEGIRYICGEKVKEENKEEYYKLLQYHRQRTQKLGYGSPLNWEAKKYEKERRILNQKKRLENLKKIQKNLTNNKKQIIFV